MSDDQQNGKKSRPVSTSDKMRLGLFVTVAAAAALAVADRYGLLDAPVNDTPRAEPYAVTTVLAQVGGADAIQMINCANRALDPNAPLIPADLDIWGYELASPGEVIYDGRPDVNPAQEARDIEWNRLSGLASDIRDKYPNRFNRDSWSEADQAAYADIGDQFRAGTLTVTEQRAQRDAIAGRYPDYNDYSLWSDDDRTSYAGLLQQASELAESYRRDGLVVEIVRNQTFSAGGQSLRDRIMLRAATGEGAYAPNTYGDDQFWFAHGLELNTSGRITGVVQMDQSIGFNGYRRDTDELNAGQRESVDRCYSPALGIARSVLGS